MPTLSVKTKSANKIWSSPDGNRTIYEVTMEYQGKLVVARTYSDKIATAGFEGEVESYKKETPRGSETFVKQVQKPFSGNKFSKDTDPFTMYLSYAKDIVVALVAAGKFKDVDYQDLIQETLGGAYTLYESRPDAPGTVTSVPTPKKAQDTVYEDNGGPINL